MELMQPFLLPSDPSGGFKFQDIYSYLSLPLAPLSWRPSTSRH